MFPFPKKTFHKFMWIYHRVATLPRQCTQVFYTRIDQVEKSVSEIFLSTLTPAKSIQFLDSDSNSTPLNIQSNMGSLAGMQPSLLWHYYCY